MVDYIMDVQIWKQNTCVQLITWWNIFNLGQIRWIPTYRDTSCFSSAKKKIYVRSVPLVVKSLFLYWRGCRLCDG